MASKSINLEDLQRRSLYWNNPPLDVIPEQYRDTYKNRKEAVDLYIQGAGVMEIERLTGIDHTSLPRLIERCTTFRQDGTEFGYAGLIPGLRLSKDAKQIGEFGRLLIKYDSLPEFIAGNYFGDKKYTLERNMSVKRLHQRFLNECIRLGVQDTEYPFNTVNLGYVSLCKYVSYLKVANTELQAKRETKDNEQKLRSTGFGKRYSTDPVAPFCAVQLDGHKIDLDHVVQIFNDDGSVSVVPGERIWIVTIIDIATRCILGFSVAEKDYDQNDVLDAVVNAILPRQRMEFTINGFRYPENGGYHSLAFPDLENAMFDMIMMDNAKAHLAKNVVEKLTNRLKIVVNYGSVATPETRGIVERCFGILEEEFFHVLPMTTGSNTRDPRRRDAEKNAIKYNVTFDQIVEYLEVAIANYNNRSHTALFGLSPLECMHKKIYESGMEPSLASEEMIKEIKQLRWKTVKRTVRGKTQSGRRPYINFLGTEYRGDELSGSHIYLGKTITIRYDPMDVSTLMAYTDQGIFIGVLHARGEFGMKSHSEKTHQKAMKLSRKRKHDKLQFSTPITDLEQHLYEQGKKSRRSATQADIVRRELKEPTPAEQIEQNKNNVIEISAPNTIPADLPADNDIRNLSAEERYEMFFKKRVGEK